jgi:hypothetical protein
MRPLGSRYIWLKLMLTVGSLLAGAVVAGTVRRYLLPGFEASGQR